MPYNSEHSCRLKSPDSITVIGSREQEHNGKAYRIIFGTPKRGSEAKSVEQAYRYPVNTWTASEARAHCTAHNGISFEPAESDTVDDVAEKLKKAIGR
jgi:hypothetical protein